jgi:RimJ/RimL family protein N-acetyltransferase
MTRFSETVEAFWRAPLSRGAVVVRADALTVVSDPTLADDRRVTIIDVGGAEIIAALSPEIAARVLTPPIRNESQLRSALSAAQVSLHPADAVFYFRQGAKDDLLGEPDPANVRRLTRLDRDAFTTFVSAAPASDLDDAYVELDHWAVFGAFRDERLVCAASMYRWGESALADLGVIALPGYRRQGLARSVVRAACRYAYAQGLEPQYRCQLDNTASRALAASAGLTWFGNWETVLDQSSA